MFVRAYDGTLDENLGRAWVAPFSLFLGWVSVATIANTTVWLVAVGFEGGPPAPAAFATAVSLIASGVAGSRPRRTLTAAQAV